MAGLRFPLSTLRLMPCGMPRMTRGHDGSLLLSCKALASSIRRRFIPALPHLRCSADFGSKKRKNRANGEILTLNWRKWARIMRRRPNKAQAWLAHSKKVLSIPGFRVPGEAGTLEGRELLECWSHAPALVFTKPCSSLGFHEAMLQPWFSRSRAPALVFTKPCSSLGFHEAMLQPWFSRSHASFSCGTLSYESPGRSRIRYSGTRSTCTRGWG